MSLEEPKQILHNSQNENLSLEAYKSKSGSQESMVLQNKNKLDWLTRSIDWNKKNGNNMYTMSEILNDVLLMPKISQHELQEFAIVHFSSRSEREKFVKTLIQIKKSRKERKKQIEGRKTSIFEK